MVAMVTLCIALIIWLPWLHNHERQCVFVYVKCFSAQSKHVSGLLNMYCGMVWFIQGSCGQKTNFRTTMYSCNTCSDGSVIPERFYPQEVQDKFRFEYKYGLRSDLRAPNTKNF